MTSKNELGSAPSLHLCFLKASLYISIISALNGWKNSPVKSLRPVVFFQGFFSLTYKKLLAFFFFCVKFDKLWFWTVVLNCQMYWCKVFCISLIVLISIGSLLTFILISISHFFLFILQKVCYFVNLFKIPSFDFNIFLVVFLFYFCPSL